MGRKLILCDIDGTLIKSAGIGATKKIIMKHFGLDSSNSKLNMEGKTYRAIIAERLEELGFQNPERDERFSGALNDSSFVQSAIDEGFIFEKISNIEILLKSLRKDDHVLGLLTGNVKESAKIKLESVDLWKHFKLGAYGNVARVRSELVEVALTEAKKTTGISFDKNDVFIVGDTPLDIECAKHGGVKSVAIATGQKSLKELNQNMPDYAFEDFSDIESMLKIFT